MKNIKECVDKVFVYIYIYIYIYVYIYTCIYNIYIYEAYQELRIETLRKKQINKTKRKYIKITNI